MNKRKIAVVEDDHAISSMYCFKLQNAGYDVRPAHNGKHGLEVIEQFRPDLVLLDIKMPIMDGAEMLEELRTTEWGGNIRVVVLTNISRDEAPHNLRFLNVDRYIVKAHHTPAQVLEIVNQILN
jgi:DNA-binding response OmpR family regulator